MYRYVALTLLSVFGVIAPLKAASAISSGTAYQMTHSSVQDVMRRFAGAHIRVQGYYLSPIVLSERSTMVRVERLGDDGSAGAASIACYEDGPRSASVNERRFANVGASVVIEGTLTRYDSLGFYELHGCNVVE